jgi:hypothetical protein
MDDNLLKYRTPMHHLDCLLCLLAELHLDDARNYVVQQLDDYTFQTSREKRLALDILYCVQEVDVDLLVDHIWNFDYVVEFSHRQLILLEIVVEAVKATKANTQKKVAASSLQEAMQERVDMVLAADKSDTGSSWGSDEESSSDEDEHGNPDGAAASSVIGPSSPIGRGSIISGSSR